MGIAQVALCPGAGRQGRVLIKTHSGTLPAWAPSFNALADGAPELSARAETDEFHGSFPVLGLITLFDGYAGVFAGGLIKNDCHIIALVGHFSGPFIGLFCILGDKGDLLLGL